MVNAVGNEPGEVSVLLVKLSVSKHAKVLAPLLDTYRQPRKAGTEHSCIHQEPRHAAVAVEEGMDPNEPEMRENASEQPVVRRNVVHFLNQQIDHCRYFVGVRRNICRIPDKDRCSSVFSEIASIHKPSFNRWRKEVRAQIED